MRSIPAAALLPVLLTLGLHSAPVAEPPSAEPSGAPPAQHQAAEADESPLGRAMEGLQNGMRELRGLSKGSEDAAACLAVLHGMQASAIAAMQLEPPLPEDREPPPAEQLAVWKVEFKRQVLKLLDKLLELEVAVLEGRFEELQAGFTALSEIKNNGHYEYQ